MKSYEHACFSPVVRSSAQVARPLRTRSPHPAGPCGVCARVRVCIFVRQVRALRKKCAELEAENEILLEEAVSARHAAF